MIGLPQESVKEKSQQEKEKEKLLMSPSHKPMALGVLGSPKRAKKELPAEFYEVWASDMADGTYVS
mgnify:CR=1 FL=1